MLLRILRSKLHRAVVTAADVDYVGSITIDEDLIDAAGLVPGEIVLVADLNNGNRLETYVMAGPRRSGTVCMNGAAARLIDVGDRIIVMAWGMVEASEARQVQPTVLVLDAHNHIAQRL